jgi:uncharacterized protein YdaU (DUF1376 family)
MHYYQFNIGDFALHTSHLTLEEEAIYRRLLDYYYDTELPIPKETQPVIRRLRLGSHADMTNQILREFFILQDDGWHNLRADIEINDYQNKATTARINGKKGGRPKKTHVQKTQPVILANPDLTQPKANQELLTNNYKPITNNQTIKSRAAALDYNAWPEQASDQVLKDWLDMRKRLKANVSQTVINSFCTELTKAAASGYSVDQCLSECVTRNWRGFKFDWLLNSEVQNGNGKGNNFQTRQTREQRMEQALNEVFGSTDSGALEGDFEKIVSNGFD